MTKDVSREIRNTQPVLPYEQAMLAWAPLAAFGVLEVQEALKPAYYTLWLEFRGT